MIARGGKGRKNWDDLCQSVMIKGTLTMAEAFLGMRHYHAIKRHYKLETDDEVIFQMHNEAIRVSRHNQRGKEKDVVRDFKVGDIVKTTSYNTGACQGGSSLPVSAHARTLNPPP